VVTHESTRGQQYHSITEHWTLDDLLDANEVLDAIDEAHQRQMKAARKRGTS
jgi:hypothetical protein